jgi:hypothetical protein
MEVLDYFDDFGNFLKDESPNLDDLNVLPSEQEANFSLNSENENRNESSPKFQFQNQVGQIQSFSIQKTPVIPTDQPMSTTFPSAVLPVNRIPSFNLVHENHNNRNVQTKIQLNDSFKISFFEALIINFPKEPRDFICQYLKSPNCPAHMKSARPLQYIKREKIENIIKFLHQFHSEFCSILTESNCVFLLLNIYRNHIKQVSNQKKTKIKRFIELYKVLDGCLEQNTHLGNIKTEVSVLSSSF